MTKRIIGKNRSNNLSADCKKWHVDFLSAFFVGCRGRDEQVVLCPGGGSGHDTWEIQSKVAYHWFFSFMYSSRRREQ